MSAPGAPLRVVQAQWGAGALRAMAAASCEPPKKPGDTTLGAPMARFHALSMLWRPSLPRCECKAEAGAFSRARTHSAERAPDRGLVAPHRAAPGARADINALDRIIKNGTPRRRAWRRVDRRGDLFSRAPWAPCPSSAARSTHAATIIQPARGWHCRITTSHTTRAQRSTHHQRATHRERSLSSTPRTPHARTPPANNP